jgi:electron transfer flavoprotein beta subunit
MRVAPSVDPRSGRVREEWLVRQPDPAAERALDFALRLRDALPAAALTVVRLGPSQDDLWLRWALARGADGALRVWSEELEQAGVEGKALVLAEAARASGFDLVLTGACGVTHGRGQLGVLLAEHLGVPCVTQADYLARPVASAAPDVASIEVTRALARGYRQRVAVPLPAVVTVSAAPAGPAPAAPSPTAGARLRAEAAAIPVWDLADLGVPLARLGRAGDALRTGPPVPRRPRLHPLAGPDPSLPAFDRILKLIEGGVQQREGKVVHEVPSAVAEALFRALLEEGWLDHLRSADRGQTGALS